VSIASVTDVTLATASVPNIAAGDVVLIEVAGTILNNSGGNRTYTWRLSVGTFVVEGTTLAQTTSTSPRIILASSVEVCVRSASDVAALAAFSNPPTATADDVQVGTSPVRLLKWKASTTDDITGTQTAT